jgi:sulfur carrier protein
MQITINGNPQEIAPGTSLLDLLASRGLEPATVVVELNRSIVERGTYAQSELRDGDVLEVLRFVGGG